MFEFMLNVFPDTDGMVGKSSAGRLLTKILLFFEFIDMFPCRDSRVTVFWFILENILLRISPLTATTPSLKTLAGISISIPKLKLVERMFNNLPETLNKTVESIGRLKFLPAIRLAKETALFNLSTLTSNFIV